jgi:hypothetical protein
VRKREREEEKAWFWILFVRSLLEQNNGLDRKVSRNVRNGSKTNMTAFVVAFPCVGKQPPLYMVVMNNDERGLVGVSPRITLEYFGGLIFVKCGERKNEHSVIVLSVTRYLSLQMIVIIVPGALLPHQLQPSLFDPVDPSLS